MIALMTAPFVERYPAASTTIWSLSSIEIQRGLDDFTLDAGISYLDNEPLARVRTVPLYRERYVLITSALGPMGQRSTVGWREAAELPLCLLTPDMQNRRILDGHFRSVGAIARPHVEANSLVALGSHLRFGAYSAVLPKTVLAVIGQLPDMRAIPLVEPEVSHEVGLIVADRDPPTPVAAAAVRVAESLALGAIVDKLTWPTN
jgi:DNA-binding transcriptional LysR family regulator